MYSTMPMVCTLYCTLYSAVCTLFAIFVLSSYSSALGRWLSRGACGGGGAAGVEKAGAVVPRLPRHAQAAKPFHQVDCHTSSSSENQA